MRIFARKKLSRDVARDISKDICIQKIVNGPCLAYEKRYAFNIMSGECEQFIYGGCEENENNFKTLDECKKVCHYDCTLPKEAGPCDASIPRYYYNNETRTCEKFIYRGCEGNANNFKSEKDCEDCCIQNYHESTTMI